MHISHLEKWKGILKINKIESADSGSINKTKICIYIYAKHGSFGALTLALSHTFDFIQSWTGKKQLRNIRNSQENSISGKKFCGQPGH